MLFISFSYLFYLFISKIILYLFPNLAFNPVLTLKLTPT